LGRDTIRSQSGCGGEPPLAAIKGMQGVATEFECDGNVENIERTDIQSLGELRSEGFGSLEDLVEVKRLPYESPSRQIGL